MTDIDLLIHMLSHGKVNEFNALRAEQQINSLQGADLCGIDLRGLDVQGLDMRDCRLDHADLRGIDFSRTPLDGASFNGAKISATRFPIEISAEEINLSLLHGTRIRYR